MTGLPWLKKGKKDLVFASLGGLLVTLIILGSLLFQEEPIERVERTRFMMGTVVTITVYDTLKDAEEAIEAAFDRIDDISMAASTYHPAAEAYILNELGSIPAPSDYLLDIISLSKEYCELTNGSFDITIEPLLDLWRFKPWEDAYLIFDIEGKFGAELDSKTLSDSLRTVFAGNSYPLSENALIIKRSDMNWGIEECLFTLPPTLRGSMKYTDVGPGIRSIFTEYDQPLTKDAEISMLNDMRWNLTDGNKKFLIEDAGDRLIVAVEKFGLTHFENRLNVTVQFWDLDRSRQEQNISAARIFVGCEKIRATASGISIEDGMSITLGGIAKGYAVSEAVKVLREKGIKHGLINAGGDIETIGRKIDGTPWTIALENPRDRSDFITRFNLEGKAVCTSGNYIRYFDPEARVGHIMDPRTGFSVSHCMSVTIITDNCTTADVLATSVFVMGPGPGMDLINELDDVEGLIIDANRTIHRSQGLGVYEK